MSFLQEVETRTAGPRISLAPGTYGTSKEPGLKIVSYIEKTSKLDKNGAMRHSFLVSATRPARESKPPYGGVANGKASAAGDPIEIPDFEGTAFYELTLHELWLCPEATALAFTEASRNKEGAIQADYVAKAIADGDVTQGSIDSAIAHFRKVATDKLVAANTPADQLEEAVGVQYGKELTQIAIKVGQFLTMQDWKGIPRSLQVAPGDLVGTEFSGRVESRVFNGKTQSEVNAVYAKKR